MPVKLYFTPSSPPCRASLLTIRALDIEVELVHVNLSLQEHLTNDFLKLNPFHTVPVIEVDGFSVGDSHAINAYLVDNYGKGDTLYPRDLQKRAVINQMLHFDSHVLSARLVAIVVPILKEGVKVIPKDKADALLQGLTLVETLLEKTKYVAGDTLTIADFSLVATISTANVVLPLASNRFPKIFEWLGRLQALPYYKEANQTGVDVYDAFIKSKSIVRQTSIK